MPYLIIRQVSTGKAMERRYISTLDDGIVLGAIQAISRNLGPDYYVDDGELERERRRLKEIEDARR